MKKVFLSVLTMIGIMGYINAQGYLNGQNDPFDTLISNTGDNKYVEFNNTTTTAYRISTNNNSIGTPTLDVEYITNFGEPSSISQVMSFKGSNVGIGTTIPQEKFHVNGDSYFQGSVGVGTSNPSVRLEVVRNENPAIKIRSNNNGRWVDLGIANCTGCWSGMATDGDVVMRAKPGSNDLVIANQGTGNLILGNGDTGSEVRRLVIDASGNVGIGSSNPDSKLTVKGKIHAEEVKIDLSVPADYVFQKYFEGTSSLKEDYIFKTLDEVEEFIQKNHHLPDVPSAQYIKENGLNIGEMTNLLLQKIEELTLYTIEQEKRIKELELKVTN